MKETPNHQLRYPESKDPDTLALYYQHLAEDTERELDAIDPGQVLAPGGAGDAGKLLVVSGTGAVAAAAMKGNATLATDGTLTISAKQVVASMIADALKPSAGAAAGTEALRALGTTASTAAAGNDARLSDERVPKANSVDASKLSDGATTSRKVKLSTFQIATTEAFSLSGVEADLPGAKGEITPSVASKLLLVAQFDFLLSTSAPTEPAGTAIGGLTLDGAVQTEAAIFRFSLGTSGIHAQSRVTCAAAWILSLTAAVHTLKLRGKTEAVGANCTLSAQSARASGFLIAS